MLRHITMVAIAGTALCGIAACSSSSTSSGSGPNPSGSGSTTTYPLTYSGPEAQGITTSVPEPKKVDGVKFKVGFITPEAAVPSLVQQELGAQHAVEALGGEFISKNAASSMANMTAQFQQLLVQKVNAIIFQPIDPSAITPYLQQAAAAGVKVVTISAPATAGQPNLANVMTNFLYGVDTFCWAQARDLAGRHPGAKVAIITSSTPVASIQYTTQRQKYWAEQFGLKVVDTVATQQDTPAAAVTAGTTIFTQHPDTQAILAYDDGSAQGALGAARQAGKSNILIYGSGGDPAAVKLVKDGTLAGDAAADAQGIGRSAAYVVYDAVTNQGTIPKTVLAPGVFTTTRGTFPPIGPLTF